MIINDSLINLLKNSKIDDDNDSSSSNLNLITRKKDVLNIK